MLCSIIIPLFNKEKYIGAAIDSVLNQQYQHIEVIVVDDGSTDRSAEIVKAIQDPRIRFFAQANAGVSCARNRGIDESSGDLIFFLDADDWYDNQYLGTVVSMAQKYPSGTFFATGFETAINDQGWESDAANNPDQAVELIDDFYSRWQRYGHFFCTNTVAVWRTDLIEFQPCFPPGECLGEDQDLWFRLSEKLELAYCPSKLAAYRLHVDGSLCASHKLDALQPAFIRLQHRAKQGLIKKSLRSSALLLVADTRISVARYLISQNQRCAALVELIKGMRGCAKKRWWITVVICCVGSPGIMQHWERWRERRSGA